MTETNSHTLATTGARQVVTRLERYARHADGKGRDRTASIHRNDASDWRSVAREIEAGNFAEASRLWHRMDTLVRDYVDDLPHDERHALAEVLGFEVIR